MIEDFSSGYYRATLNVQEYDDGPVIEQRLYDFINRRLYLDSDLPVRMRVGLDAGPIFEVGAESAVPRDVLAIPEEIAPDSDVSNVFIVKPSNYYG